MKLQTLKASLIAITFSVTGTAFAADALFNPAEDNPRIIQIAQTLADPNGPQRERKCTSEKVGKKICVLCEYTAINETSYNCYAIPEKKSTGKAATGIKSAG